MRWLRLGFRVFGWLLTPFLAWAASFFGAVGGALIAMRIEDPVSKTTSGCTTPNSVTSRQPESAATPPETANASSFIRIGETVQADSMS